VRAAPVSVRLPLRPGHVPVSIRLPAGSSKVEARRRTTVENIRVEELDRLTNTVTAGRPAKGDRMRKLVVLALMLTGVLMAAAPAMAEGETVKVTSVTCSGVTVEGGGYTEGQDLTVVAKAPNGEGAITDLVTVAAGDQGSLGPVTLQFGGQVPDGTYIVEVSTPGPGQRETVTDEFTIRGCGPGGGLPFTGSHTPALLTAGVGLLVVGMILVRRAQPS